jgi:hypothetical protein
MEAVNLAGSAKPKCRLCERAFNEAREGYCYPSIHDDYPDIDVIDCHYDPRSPSKDQVFKAVNDAMDEHQRQVLNAQLAQRNGDFKNGISPKAVKQKKSSYIPTTFVNLYKAYLQAEGFVIPDTGDKTFDILDVTLPDGWGEVRKQEDRRYSIIHDARGNIKLLCFLCADVNNFACTCQFPLSAAKIPM